MPVSGSVFAASAWFAMVTDVCVKENLGRRMKGAGTKVARLALQKLRLEILGLRSRVAQTGVAAPPGTAL
jgi:hypothetical protein